MHAGTCTCVRESVSENTIITEQNNLKLTSYFVVLFISFDFILRSGTEQPIISNIELGADNEIEMRRFSDTMSNDASTAD